jgi:hypothetical protein
LPYGNRSKAFGEPVEASAFAKATADRTADRSVGWGATGGRGEPVFEERDQRCAAFYFSLPGERRVASAEDNGGLAGRKRMA